MEIIVLSQEGSITVVESESLRNLIGDLINTFSNEKNKTAQDLINSLKEEAEAKIKAIQDELNGKITSISDTLSNEINNYAESIESDYALRKKGVLNRADLGLITESFDHLTLISTDIESENVLVEFTPDQKRLIELGEEVEQESYVQQFIRLQNQQTGKTYKIRIN